MRSEQGGKRGDWLFKTVAFRETGSYSSYTSVVAAELPDPGQARRSLQSSVDSRGVRLADLDLDSARRLTGLAAAGNTPGDPQTELQALIDALCALSIEDGLTGLFNRRYFDHRLAQEIQRARRERRPISVMLVDADHFKRVNDEHGHAAGDAVLKVLASRMRDALRVTDDITSRVGGEEFAVILPGTPIEGALVAGERVREAVAHELFDIGSAELTITISVGLSSFEPIDGFMDSDLTARRLTEQADASLYRAKEAGRNTVKCHGDDRPSPGPGVSAAEKKELLG